MYMPIEEDIQRIIGATPRDMALYNTAFTHKSARKGTASYDRLEFLGDSKLSAMVAHFLFSTFPHADEGFLSRMRNAMVSRKSLAAVARALDLAPLVIMNKRALSRGWNNNDRILEDVFEALVAAVALDLGEPCATAFVVRCVADHMDLAEIERRRNYRDELIQHTQRTGGPPPRYQTEMLLDDRNYRVTVDVGAVRGSGLACIKKVAQQQAARNALDQLQEDRIDPTGASPVEGTEWR